MMTFYFQVAVSAMLMLAAVSDLKSGRVPNWVALSLIALFGVFAFVTMTPAAALWQVGFAAIVFVFGLGIYAIAGTGAGAIKLMAGAALFMPIDRGFALFGLLIATMFCLGLLVSLMHRVFQSDDSSWAVLKTRVMPLSLPVCATGLLGMFWL